MTEIRPAATILLVRDGDSGMEVLLMKRNSRSKFMPNAYVYPGGAVEAADAELPDDAFISPTHGKESHDTAPRDSEFTKFYCAAIRECFEESGLLIGTRGDKIPEEDRRRWRGDLNENTRTLKDFVEEFDLQLDLRAVHHIDHWITPPFESRRYDTHFFLIPVSPKAIAIQDDEELVDALWLTPKEALQRSFEGDVLLFPPTWATLSWLAQFEETSAAKAGAAAKQVYPIEPQFGVEDENVVAYLPGHPKHPESREDDDRPPIAIWKHEHTWSYRHDEIEYRWAHRAVES